MARSLVGYYGSGPQQQKGWTAVIYRMVSAETNCAVEVRASHHEVSIRRLSCFPNRTYTFLMLQVLSAMLAAMPYGSVLQILQFPMAAQQSEKMYRDIFNQFNRFTLLMSPTITLIN